MLDAVTARRQEDDRRFAERVEEIKCRMRFKAVGHDHDCVLDPRCSRDYDPCPDAGCEPFPEEDYVGSGVAALYGGPTEAWQVLELAGWQVNPTAEHKVDRKLVISHRFALKTLEASKWV